MAWEWVAPVATATLGVAGIFGTWLTGKQGRDDAKALAKDARQQQRLETTYVDLLDMAERTGQWAQMVYPMIDTNPPQPVPPLPSLAEQAHTEALVRAFGSSGVWKRMDAWRAVVRQMVSTVRQIEWEEAEPTRLSELSPRLTLEELRPQERDARINITREVVLEFDGDPWAEPD
ncbi:hypothetical protein [Mycobacterium sp.]|uniref:hypothetical protein n=1 Tax=Mycobacterium sp. TaxID=1785 RepID=UPI003F95F372